MENNISEREIGSSLFANKGKLKLAFSRAISLWLISLFFACAVISVINDMYAFVKPEKAIELKIDEAQSLYDFAKVLGRENIIENPLVFSLYVRSKGKENIFENISGHFSLNSSMSYREILTYTQNKIHNK